MCRNSGITEEIHASLDLIIDSLPCLDSNSEANAVAAANEIVAMLKIIQEDERVFEPVVRLSAADIVAACKISQENAELILEEVADRLGDVIRGNWYWDPMRIIVKEVMDG